MSAIGNHLAIARGMKVGLFGGSFDPAHDGHLHVAETALRRLGLDRIVWLVSPGNPLKPDRGDDLERRVAQTRTIARGRRMIVSDIEARLGTRYTLDTIRALKRRHPGVHFVWLMGADNLAQFHRWRGWAEIFAEIPIAVVGRPGQPVGGRMAIAARRFAAARVPAARGRMLAILTPPAWTYLRGRWNYTSSTALRSRSRAAAE